jgi:hypothetical protein
MFPPKSNTDPFANASFYDRKNDAPQVGEQSSPRVEGSFPPTETYRPVAITYEELGLLPRSFNRVFDRFFKQLFDDVENLVLEEYRFYRYLFLTTAKGLTLLLIVPLLVNVVSKHYVVRPLVEFYWNTAQPELFLNQSEQKRAFQELHDFEETLYFDALTLEEVDFDDHPARFKSQAGFDSTLKTSEKTESALTMGGASPATVKNSVLQKASSPVWMADVASMEVQKKVLELADHYNERSIQAITNFLSDLLSLGTVLFVLLTRRSEMDITKSFLLEVFFGMDDTKKSLVMLIVTDFLVGYHSPTIWESFFQFVFGHYGLPQSQTAIFLLVATIPVLVDVVFKYLIFRHLNRVSPSTVAVYHALIESVFFFPFFHEVIPCEFYMHDKRETVTVSAT